MTPYVPVDIFRITAVLDLDPWRFRETKPMYGAMIEGEERYLCFVDDLRNLPLDISRKVINRSQGIIPRNLNQTQYFKKMSFGDDHQVVIRHEPLSVDEVVKFTSRVYHDLGYWYKVLMDELTKKNEEKIKELTIDQKDDQEWLG